MRGQGKKLVKAAELLARGRLRIPDPEGEEAAPDDQFAEALAAVGLKAEEELASEEVFELWPVNVKAFNFWRSVQTQWMYAGMGQAVGLNYLGVETCMRLQQIRKKEQSELFGIVQAMEAATLREWANRSNQGV